MIYKKVFLFLFMQIFNIFFISSEATRIGYVKGMSAVPFTYLISDNKNFEFTEYETMENLLNDIYIGDIDIANLPVNVALTLFEKTDGAFVCVSATQYMNYFVVSLKSEESEKTFEKKNISSLIEKNVGIVDSSFSQKILTWLLEKNGIPIGIENSGTSMIKYKSENNIVSDLINKKITMGVLSEPAVSAALKGNKDLYISVDLQDSYLTISGNNRNIPINLLVTSSNFVDKQYDSLLIILQKLENSINQINRKPLQTSKLISKYDLGISSSVSGNAISRGNFRYKAANQCQQDIKDYVEIYNYNTEGLKISYPKKKFF